MVAAGHESPFAVGALVGQGSDASAAVAGGIVPAARAWAARLTRTEDHRGGSIRPARWPCSGPRSSPSSWFSGPSSDRGHSCGCSLHREALVVAVDLAAATLSGRQDHSGRLVAAAADSIAAVAVAAGGADRADRADRADDVAGVAGAGAAAVAAGTCQVLTWTSSSASGRVAARNQRCWRRLHRAGNFRSPGSCRSPVGTAGLGGDLAEGSWPL